MIRTGTNHLYLSLIILLSLFSGAALADDGSVIIRSASSTLQDGVHNASARIQFQLSDRIEEALANGIALEVALDFEIYRSRRFWADANVATLQVVNVLRYNQVSERYMLRNLNTGKQTTYATIFAALNAMGRVDNLPLVDAPLLRDDARHIVRLRADISIAEYPVSLRYFLFWRDDWRVSSDWFSWPLVP